MSVISYMKKYFLLLFALQSCMGWGDMFAKRERITGNYYLIENEGGMRDISYKVVDGYIARTPSNCKVVAYAVKDTILIMKVQPYRGDIFYFAINMKKDYETAKQEEYELDSVSLKDIEKSWLGKMNLHFQDVE